MDEKRNGNVSHNRGKKYCLFCSSSLPGVGTFNFQIPGVPVNSKCVFAVNICVLGIELSVILLAPRILKSYVFGKFMYSRCVFFFSDAVGYDTGGKHRSTDEKVCPNATLSTTDSSGLYWDQTQASTVTSRGVAA